jgi:hypothetical protein
VSALLAFDGLRMISWVLYSLVSWPLFLYAWILHGHILGRTYRQGLRRLQWFVPATAETRTARRMSASLAIGAAVATVLLCGVAWGATRAFAYMAGGGSASAAFVNCPVKDGSRLTYFWEHTDGGGGLTTYSFTAVPGGNLRVLAHQRSSERPEFCSPGEELGVMNPATGRFVSVGPAWGDGTSFAGRVDEHVAFFGPKKASVGSAYLNDWAVRGSERWCDAWSAWRVQYTDETRASADYYYDARTGILVGRKFAGVGFKVTTWLVAARDVAGAVPGPRPSYDFGTQPLDWIGEGGAPGNRPEDLLFEDAEFGGDE